jgi:hypothetical protein
MREGSGDKGAAEKQERVQIEIDNHQQEEDEEQERMTPLENDQDSGNNSPGEIGSPGKSYNSVPTQELPQSPSKRSTMFEKRKAQDISWENLNFTVNQEIHVLRHVWGKPPISSIYSQKSTTLIPFL